MDLPQLTSRQATVLGGDYLQEPFYFFVGSVTVPDDFTGCTVGGGLYQNGAKVVDLAAYVTKVNNPASVSIAVPAAVMTPLGVGQFTGELWLTTGTGSVQPLIGWVLEQARP